MNDSRNNAWAIGIIAVLVASSIALCACLFGLAVGVGIGQARARAQIDNIFEFAPEEIVPAIPDMPVMPEMDQLLDMMSGAIVGEVVAGGPAEQAGIEPGDLIIAIDGEEITPDRTLADLVAAYAPGDEVTVTIVPMSRGVMSEEEVLVVLGSNPNDESVGFLGVRVVPFFSEEGPGRP